jgi:hypothetical protein
LTEHPDWIADFLNRRTEVEHALRAPLNAIKEAQKHKRPAPELVPLTAEQTWDLANKLSVPSEFGVTYRPRYQAPHDVAEQIAQVVEPFSTAAAATARHLFPKPESSR